MKDLKNERIALIGGAGFIGHNLALSLKSRGAEVSVVDSLQVNNLLAFMGNRQTSKSNSGYLDMLQSRLALLNAARIPLYVQDARDYHALGKVLSDIAPTKIVLLAAVAHANQSNKDPFSTFDHSLRTLENALDWARGGHIEHFVYFSSSMAYGDFPNGMVSEETVCNPKGIYGSLKFAGEKIVQAYGQVFNLPFTIVRPSALYGPRCVSRRVVQIFIENAVEGKEVVVNGDGSERLDFTHVDDLIQGITRVLQTEKSKGEIFNLTYGRSRSVAELAEIVKAECPSLALRFEPKDALMPERGTLSVDKARSILGYEPQFPLERGVPSYLNWYRSQFERLQIQETKIIQLEELGQFDNDRQTPHGVLPSPIV